MTANICVYTDSKSHSKLDLELRTGPEVLQKLREGGVASPDASGGGALPSLVPIERKAVKRNKVREFRVCGAGRGFLCEVPLYCSKS